MQIVPSSPLPPGTRTPAPTAGDDRTAPAQATAAHDLATLRHIDALRQRDRTVRAHEQAHQIAGGAHAGAPTYIYATGPDGRRYAIGGSVPIDVSSASSPEATIAKMLQVRRAALAPQNPSAADRAIAARANLHLAEARREVMSELLAERYGAGERTAADLAPGTQLDTSA